MLCDAAREKSNPRLLSRPLKLRCFIHPDKPSEMRGAAYNGSRIARIIIGIKPLTDGRDANVLNAMLMMSPAGSIWIMTYDNKAANSGMNERIATRTPTRR
jgi:hypothetical protein